MTGSTEFALSSANGGARPSLHEEKERTMRITKLLAVAGVIVAAVACNGISPTAPNATVTSEEATTFAAAEATQASVAVPDSCRDITTVELRVYRSRRFARIEAIYLNHDAPVSCSRAPEWRSRPRGRLSPTPNPFVVTATLNRPPDTVQATAEAPNGVTGSILIQ